MAGKPWTDDEARFVAELYAAHVPPDQIFDSFKQQFPDSDRTHVAIQSAPRKIGKVRKLIDELGGDTNLGGIGAEMNFDKGGGRTITSKPSKRITTLEELLEVAGLKFEDWEICWVQPNSWEVGMKLPTVTRSADGSMVTTYTTHVERLFQIKAKLQPLVGADTLREVKDEILAELRNETNHRGPVTVTPIQSNVLPENLLEVCLFDLHLGKLTWAMETGQNFDLKIATRLFREAVDHIVTEAAQYGITRVLLPLGNDFFHTDNPDNTTTAGTLQDVDGRWAKAFMTARRLLKETIEKLLIIGSVDVVVIPGNHDRTKTWFLGEVLDAEFSNDDRVHIDNQPKLRKYYRFGKVLLGFTHGKDERFNKLPNLMAREAPEAWGKSWFHEFHVGHFHSDWVKEFEGVRLRVLPSLAATDAWHFQKGFAQNVREAQGMVWNRDRGLLHTIHYNIIPTAREKDLAGPGIEHD